MLDRIQWLFMNVSFPMVVEIAILFLAIYGVLYYLRSTRGSLMLLGIFIFWAAGGLMAQLLNLNVIVYISEIFGNSLLLALLVIFQPELRRALAQLGSFTVWQGKRRREVIGEVVLACENMARRKCGALIVLERRIHLQTLVEDSIMLDSKVSAPLLESIFFPNAPLHDGAVIVRNDRVVAARAILPLTRAEHVSRHLGTRHRAALGISEECDAIAVVVSEETGSISLAQHGVFHRDLNGRELEQLLDKLLLLNEDAELNETVQMLEAQAEQKEEEKC